MKVSALTLVLSIILFRDGQLQAQNSEAQSAFSAIRLNNAAIKAFDILIEIDSFIDKDEESATEKKLLHRIMYDDAAGRAAHLKWGEANLIKNKEASVRLFGEAWTTDGKRGFYGRIPGRISRKEMDLEEMCSRSEMHNPTLFGVSLLEDSRHWGDEKTKRVLHFQALAQNFELLPSRKARFDVSIESPDPRYAVRLQWTVSTDTNMPSALRLVTVDQHDSKSYPTHSESWEWAEVDGIEVPISVYREKRHGARNADGEEFAYLVTEDCRIHWLSLNKPEEIVLPNYDILNDTEKFRMATSPDALKKDMLKMDKN